MATKANFNRSNYPKIKDKYRYLFYICSALAIIQVMGILKVIDLFSETPYLLVPITPLSIAYCFLPRHCPTCKKKMLRDTLRGMWYFFCDDCQQKMETNLSEDATT